MAPIPTSPSVDASAVPLADYFFISGIESTQVYDEKTQNNGTTSPAGALDDTIEEDRALEVDEPPRPKSTEFSPDNGAKRRSSRLSYDPRKSTGSFIALAETKTSDSNRSSATIKGIQINGTELTEADFEKALRKFAEERETFLEDIQFSAGAVVTPASRTPRPRPKTQRIVSEDVGSLRSGVGTLRRRISTMSSMKRQPSVVRNSSIYTSKRLSGYNSVIPAPQPFQVSPNEHPLKRRYEPVLLDRYPPKTMSEEVKRRNPFPDYVPMFAFPNDINVVSSDERPRSTWHGFAMTNGDNSKLYGICLTIWQPLNASAAAALEQQCEEWRKANMSSEERELANSLGERLAGERAKLSRLLAQLPTVASGSPEREQLEDDISAVEEKIGLMTDLLRPVRHGAAAKIEGLTDSETGLWIPRAYGVLGRDGSMTGFWKEWLKAVVVPMTSGGILRVPASSPKIGMWQPLERYVVNLCAEAPSPITSLTQVEISIRELRMYARKEASNELPGSRGTDLYALFRSLSIPNIITLFEYVLAEARIILLSSHTAMLHLSSAAITNLLFPMKWAGVFIPVLPARLIQALEAPCPYIVGVERRYDHIELPDDDFVLVDLDRDVIESTARPMPMPRQQRRKLTSLLQLSAPHHNRFGVPVGPPAYAIETFPFDAFSSESTSIFNHRASSSTLAQLVSLNSNSFAECGVGAASRHPIFNAFLQSRSEHSRGALDRPTTSSTGTNSHSPPSPPKLSPVSGMFPNGSATAMSRSDSGFALQASLREKRSGHFDNVSRRSSSFGMERMATMRRPSLPFLSQPHSTPSTTTLGTESTPGGGGGGHRMGHQHTPSAYAPSVYAQSTLAASTIMPGVLMQPVRDSEQVKWMEGHCLQWRPHDERSTCSVCEDKADDGIYKCSGCTVYAHPRCALNICLVCPAAFRPDQVRAAFVRCFASLFYTYRKFLGPPSGDQKRAGHVHSFNMDGFLRSIPNENAGYMQMLQQTQAFNEFIYEREKSPSSEPRIALFDQIILSKKNRGRTSLFSKSSTDFLTSTSDHLWRSAAATPPNSRFPGDYRQVTSRIPAKLDPALMKEPRAIQGVPRIPVTKARRKPIPSLLGSKQTRSEDLPSGAF
ncbi:DENN-domain-containing protein [Aulographum hederae CBS 113979]|uniref:DENN-domain-containing protein n=1 Tax=Aulographum hederae CBS 113979 TaxID=1176131 RepID=A0A6G1H4L7_9PEZI|nr:DENN-domain-containing protein [Aulographum hederae CBS 113979]